MVVNTQGVWTLADLGSSDLVLLGSEKVEAHSIEFCLPDDAAQGPDSWYILHFDFEITFEEDSTDGFCVVSADTNGFTCAQIEFKTRRENGGLVVDWSSLGLIDGLVNGTESTASMDVSF